MKIGEWVKEYRKKHDISMETLGKMCGLSRAYISILEKGINPTTKKPFAPSVPTIAKIAKATGEDFEILFNMLDADQLITVNSGRKNNINCSNEEAEMLKKYRALDERGKKAVQDTLNREFNYTISEKEITEKKA